MATAEGYDPAVWRQLSEDLALPGIHVPEQYGGAGFGMVELCIVTEELGRALLCAPYFSTAVLAANAILNAGTEAQKSALLPEIAKGARLATLAVTEPDGNWDPAEHQGCRHSRFGQLPSRRSQKLRRGRPRSGAADRRCARPEDHRPSRGWLCSRSMRMPAAWNDAFWNRWIRRARSRASIFAALMRTCSATSMTVQSQSSVLSIRRLSRLPTRWWAAPRPCSTRR